MGQHSRELISLVEKFSSDPRTPVGHFTTKCNSRSGKGWGWGPDSLFWPPLGPALKCTFSHIWTVKIKQEPLKLYTTGDKRSMSASISP